MQEFCYEGQVIWKVTRLLVNQKCQGKEFSAFLCMGNAEVWPHWKHFFDMHLPIWGQCPMFSQPKFAQGSWGVAAV